MFEEKRKAMLEFIKNEFNSIINTNFVDNSGTVDKKEKIRVTNEINNIIKEYGLGIGILVQHQQGVASGYLKNSTLQVLEGNTSKFVYLPIRSIRGNKHALIEEGIFVKNDVISEPEIHHNEKMCYFCSAPRINPKEILSAYKVERGEEYQAGFTFAPFGNPERAIHFLVWNKLEKTGSLDPQKKHNLEVENMDFTNKSLTDIVELVNTMNNSIKKYCEEKKNDYILLDAIFNGWAGNSIYHKHFQFFALNNLPVTKLESQKTWQLNGNTKVSLLKNPAAIYKIEGNDYQEVTRTANEIIKQWLNQEEEGVEQKVDGIDNHTQNTFIPGDKKGKVIYFYPRFRSRTAPDIINDKFPKAGNFATMEMSRYFIVGNEEKFNELQKRDKQSLDKIADIWHEGVNPREGIEKFEAYLTRIAEKI